MAYSVVFRKSARKQIGQLSEIAVSKITTAIDALADEPRPANCKKMQGERVRTGFELATTALFIRSMIP